MKIQRGDMVKLTDGREGLVVQVEVSGVVEVRAGGIVFSHVECLKVIGPTREAVATATSAANPVVRD